MKNSNAYIWPFYLFGAIATFFAVSLSLDIQVIPVDVRNYEDLFNIIGFFWFTAMVAHSNGISDAARIKTGLGINHAKSFMHRLIWICAAAYIMQINVLYIFSAGFFFSTMFNFTLNDERALKWFYISDSNVYDRLFLALFNASLTGNDVEEVKRAGKTKVITESVLAVLLFVVVYLIFEV